jgi:hypothetical protein
MSSTWQLVEASSCDLEKFCTLPDRVLWYDEFCTTSLHQQGDGTISSPSDLRIAAGDSHDICGLRDLYDPRGLCDRLC